MRGDIDVKSRKPETVPGAKFTDPKTTIDGSPRAHVGLDRLETLWVNTGTLCNVECSHCYIESSPKNDRLVYIRRAELAPYLDEAAAMGAQIIGFTGGEPFLNPDAPDMIADALAAGFSVLVLTNAMRPMQRPKVSARLVELNAQYGEKLSFRVSIDHYTDELHDLERGAGSFKSALDGLAFFAENKFSFSIAGRFLSQEGEAALRQGYSVLFKEQALPLNGDNSEDLVIFPEMDEEASTPEITESCWEIVGVAPSDVMCSNSRMLIKRKGAPTPVVTACTLIAYDDRFEMGETLADAARPISLNHPHCAKFCVLGGASCSG